MAFRVMLTSAPSARFLHTASFLNGLMLVFGGNTHNDTAHSHGAKCYSHDFLVYDVSCDSWTSMPVPSALRADLARFGHSAVVFENSMYIYGGFDGQMLNHMLKWVKIRLWRFFFMKLIYCFNIFCIHFKCSIKWIYIDTFISRSKHVTTTSLYRLWSFAWYVRAVTEKIPYPPCVY